MFENFESYVKNKAILEKLDSTPETPYHKDDTKNQKVLSIKLLLQKDYNGICETNGFLTNSEGIKIKNISYKGYQIDNNGKFENKNWSSTDEDTLITIINYLKRKGIGSAKSVL